MPNQHGPLFFCKRLIASRSSNRFSEVPQNKRLAGLPHALCLASGTNALPGVYPWCDFAQLQAVSACASVGLRSQRSQVRLLHCALFSWVRDHVELVGRSGRAELRVDGTGRSPRGTSRLASRESAKVVGSIRSPHPLKALVSRWLCTTHQQGEPPPWTRSRKESIRSQPDETR